MVPSNEADTSTVCPRCWKDTRDMTLLECLFKKNLGDGVKEVVLCTTPDFDFTCIWVFR